MKTFFLRLAMSAGVLAIAGDAAGQPGLLRQAASENVAQSVGGWTVGGASAGFGLGFLVGMGAYDDAINAEQKIWTSALVGSVVGGVVGFAVGWNRRSPNRTPSRVDGVEPRRLTAAEVAQLARSVHWPLRRDEAMSASAVGPSVAPAPPSHRVRRQLLPADRAAASFEGE